MKETKDIALITGSNGRIGTSGLGMAIVNWRVKLEQHWHTLRQQMQREGDTDEAGGRLYRATVSAERASSDFTVRLIPHHPGIAVPLEAYHITWQEKQTDQIQSRDAKL